MLDALHARPGFGEEEWLIIALSDHGGDGNGHHAQTEACKTIFWVMQGPAVAPGEIEPPPEIVDVAVTALTYFGVAIEPAWDLDGRCVGLAGGEVGGLQCPGDGTQDGSVDLGDAVWVLGYLFMAGPIPLPCGDGRLGGDNLRLLDANGDERLDISDVVYLLRYLFGSGPPPALGTGCVHLATCPDVCRP